MDQWVGYRWLAQHYDVAAMQALPVETRLGKSRGSETDGMTCRRTIRLEQAPAATPGAQLGYALKHEGVHLELLARLFAVMPAAHLEAWIRSVPSGQYARRAGFLFEWLTGRRLDIAALTAASYVDALDPSRELTAQRVLNDARWRVRDNLLGTRDYCPQVRRLSQVEQALQFDVAGAIAGLEQQFSPDLVLRSAVWLSIKESRSSFAIEREADQLDRIQRFAAVIEARTGQAADPLDPAELQTLQLAILGPQALHYGMRRSPVFVGETDRYGQDQVHYIAPHWADLPDLLAGLRTAIWRTQGGSPIARAALASFGFVYLHPMVDGNGRISRFLINDLLRCDGALPAPYILPVSAVLQQPGLRPMNYDGALELYSRPLMRQLQGRWSFGTVQRGTDGVEYNLQFAGWEEVGPTWRYPDLSQQVVFLANVLERTIEQEMRAEAIWLQQHRRARAAHKELLEGPDAVLDRIIRSIRENRGEISGKLRAEYPQLADATFAERIARAVLDALSS